MRKKWCAGLLLLIFALIPFQKRLHGAVDSFSRSLPRPDFVLPEYFSTKVHLYFSDLLILLVAALVFWAYKPSLRAFFWQGPSKYWTLLLMACVASVSCSVTSTYSLSYFRVMELAIPILLFHTLRVLSSQIDITRFVTWVCWILVVTCLFECAVGTIQYFTMQPVGLEFLGEKHPSHFIFVNADRHRWFLDNLLNPGQEFPYLCRASGTFSHPNVFGGFIFCSLLASCFLFVQPLYKLQKSFLLFAVLVQFFALSIVLSRSAIVALCVGGALWCLFQLRRQGRAPKGVLLTLFGSGALCMILFCSQFIARGGLISYNQVSRFADSERLEYMQVALRMWKEHPLLGGGWNNFQLLMSNYQEGLTHSLFSKVHNIYLLLLAETGLIGGGLFLCGLFAILHAAWKGGLMRGEGAQVRILLICVFVGLLLIGLCDFYLIASPHGSLLFFGVAGCLAGSAKVFVLPKAES